MFSLRTSRQFWPRVLIGSTDLRPQGQVVAKSLIGRRSMTRCSCLQQKTRLCILHFIEIFSLSDLYCWAAFPSQTSA